MLRRNLRQINLPLCPRQSNFDGAECPSEKQEAVRKTFQPTENELLNQNKPLFCFHTK